MDQELSKIIVAMGGISKKELARLHSEYLSVNIQSELVEELKNFCRIIAKTDARKSSITSHVLS